MTRTRQEVQKIVENLGYEFLDEYLDEKSRRRVVIRDDERYRYDIQLSGLMEGHVPNFVDNGNLFSLPNIALWLEREKKPFVLCENNVYIGSNKKLFFQCIQESCQEIFDMSWNDIYTHNGGCPFCVGQRVGKYNNLAYLRLELVAEWDYNKNKKTPEEYTEFSSEKVSWICSECGHHWDAFVYSRSNGKGCPKCGDFKKESTVANSLKKYFEENYNAIPEYKVFKNYDTGYWLPFDIYIPHGENPDLNGFYIEVHWEQHYKVCSWHKFLAKRNKTSPEEEFEYQKYKDRLKRNFAKKNGNYIEIDLRKIKTPEEAIEYIENIILT